MSFVTGTAQRQGFKAATQGKQRTHVGSTPYPAADLLRQPGTLRAPNKRRRAASVGDDNATGLVIHGTREFNAMEGVNPDDTSPPVSGTALSNPDFPISYNGRGTMKFVSPIRITTIDGPLNVNGDVYSSAGLLSGGVDDVAIWDVEIGETGAGNNFTVDAANTWSTYARTKDHVSLHIHYSWTDKGSVADESQIFIKGLPFALETQVHKALIHPTGIIASQLGSYFVAEGLADATQFGLYSADSATGAETPVTGAGCSTTGTISCLISYHASL